jgi:hypothetical protein
MKTELTIVVITLMMTSSAVSQMSLPPQPGPGVATPGTVAALPSELRDAVLRDADCRQTAEPASDKVAQTGLLETSVDTRDIRSAGGANVGVIIRFSDACHCHDAICGTYVFLRDDAGYKLAFSGDFSSLHPVRVFKRGYPSLSGKVQLSKAQAESTVYDWNGKSYAPGLCATITQTGRKVPSIVHHDCAKAP